MPHDCAGTVTSPHYGRAFCPNPGVLWAVAGDAASNLVLYFRVHSALHTESDSDAPPQTEFARCLSREKILQTHHFSEFGGFFPPTSSPRSSGTEASRLQGPDGEVGCMGADDANRDGGLASSAGQKERDEPCRHVREVAASSHWIAQDFLRRVGLTVSDAQEAWDCLDSGLGDVTWERSARAGYSSEDGAPSSPSTASRALGPHSPWSPKAEKCDKDADGAAGGMRSRLTLPSIAELRARVGLKGGGRKSILESESPPESPTRRNSDLSSSGTRRNSEAELEGGSVAMDGKRPFFGAKVHSRSLTSIASRALGLKRREKKDESESPPSSPDRHSPPCSPARVAKKEKHASSLPSIRELRRMAFGGVDTKSLLPPKLVAGGEEHHENCDASSPADKLQRGPTSGVLWEGSAGSNAPLGQAQTPRPS